MRELIVDDEVDVFQALKTMLGGHALLGLRTGSGVLRSLHQGSVDMILVPGLEGRVLTSSVGTRGSFKRPARRIAQRGAMSWRRLMGSRRCSHHDDF